VSAALAPRSAAASKLLEELTAVVEVNQVGWVGVLLGLLKQARIFQFETVQQTQGDQAAHMNIRYQGIASNLQQASM
jgi:hypothetical protein